MSLLADLERESVPRSDDVAVRVGKRMASGSKLVFYAFLWLCTVALAAGFVVTLIILGISHAAGVTHDGHPPQVLGLIGIGASQILAWSWFAVRIRRLRAQAIELGREGTVVDARIKRVPFVRNRYWFIWRFDLDGQHYVDKRTFIGATSNEPHTVKVLAKTGAKYGLIFTSGDGYLTRMRVNQAWAPPGES